MGYNRGVPGGIAIVAEWLLLAVGLVLISLPAVYLRLPWLAAIPLAFSFGMRFQRTRHLIPRTDLSLPWLLFIATALWGAYISIEPELAWAQLVRLLGAFAVFCALLDSSYLWKRRLAWLVLAGMACLALYWPLTHSFANDPGKFTLVSQVGMAINAALPEPPGTGITPNTAGGMLAVGVPFGVALAWISWKEKHRSLTWLAVALTVLVLAGLVLTSSRGAMLGLLSAGVLTVLAQMQTRHFSDERKKALFWGIFSLALAGFVLGVALSGQFERLAGAVPDPNGSLQSRMEIWRQGFLLAKDYAFTGAGLASFRIVFSIYSLLIHVPYHDHMHNLYLETWFEQGLLGLAALFWGMLVLLPRAWHGLVPSEKNIVFNENAALHVLGWAGMAALVAMGVHGLVDVVFTLKRSLPLVGLVIAFAALLDRGIGIGNEGVKQPLRSSWLAWIGAGVGLAALLLLAAFHRPLLGAWYANLGALAQTRLELSRYNPDRFNQPSLDQIRRDADLTRTQAHFEQALQYDPTNRTAITRLAEIALSRGDYPAARQLLERGGPVGDFDHTERLLYGDVLVAEGRFEEAAHVMGGITKVVDHLLFLAKYRYWNQGDARTAANSWLAVLLIEPGNREARSWLNKVP